MPKLIKNILGDYLSLFGQPPVQPLEDDRPGYVQDRENLAEDWRQVGRYLALAGFELSREKAADGQE